MRLATGRCAIYRSILLVLCLFLTLGGVLLGTGVAQRKVMKGEAVYYANRYKGQTMACGGRYKPKKMIAAHRTLPCGTKLRVKNRANGKKVTVTVKDRGPYSDSNTILDLSRRAARKLGYIHAGRTKVRAVIVGG
ncbi:MAG: septal ring lytic transglycosylase RlpA family protein [Actinomycetota bacterium]